MVQLIIARLPPSKPFPGLAFREEPDLRFGRG